MINFSVLMASMSSGFMGGLFRFWGTLPMSIFCMLVMHTQGLRPGLHSYLSVAAGQTLFLLFFLLAPYPLLELWYLCEPTFLIIGLYCMVKMLIPYIKLVASFWPKYAVMPDPTSPKSLRELQFTLSYPRYFFIATLCGTAELGGSLFQTQGFNFTALHLYPIAYIFPYVLIGLAINVSLGFGITRFLRSIYIDATYEKNGILGVIYALMISQSLVVGSYSYGLYYSLPLQAVGVPAKLVPFHEHAKLGIRYTEEDPELLVWYGPDLLPGDKEENVNQKRENSWMEEGRYIFEDHFRTVLFQIWEKSPLTWLTRAINLARMDLCTPTNLRDTTRRSTPLVANFGAVEGEESVGFAWNKWYWTPERPGQPTYDRALRRPDVKETTRPGNWEENRFFQDLHESRLLQGKNINLDVLRNTAGEKIGQKIKQKYNSTGIEEFVANTTVRREVFDTFVQVARDRLLHLKRIRTKNPALSLEDLSSKQCRILNRLALKYGSLAWQMSGVLGPENSGQFLATFSPENKEYLFEVSEYVNKVTEDKTKGMDFLTQSILLLALDELDATPRAYNKQFRSLLPSSSLSLSDKRRFGFETDMESFHHRDDVEDKKPLWTQAYGLSNETVKDEAEQQRAYAKEKSHPRSPKPENDPAAEGYQEKSVFDDDGTNEEDLLPVPFHYPSSFYVGEPDPKPPEGKESKEDKANKAKANAKAKEAKANADAKEKAMHQAIERHSEDKKLVHINFSKQQLDRLFQEHMERHGGARLPKLILKPTEKPIGLDPISFDTQGKSILEPIDVGTMFFDKQGRPIKKPIDVNTKLFDKQGRPIEKPRDVNTKAKAEVEGDVTLFKTKLFWGMYLHFKMDQEGRYRLMVEKDTSLD